jgi:excisionase family DNA binding protein
MKEIVLDEFLTIKQAQALTHYSRKWLYMLCRRGKIYAGKVGGMWLIKRDSLLSYKAHRKLGRPVGT